MGRDKGYRRKGELVGEEVRVSFTWQIYVIRRETSFNRNKKSYRDL